MEVETKKVNLSDLNLNPDNPRTISTRDMDRLVTSLQEFPEMLELREIVVDEDMTILGGNMRTLALRKAGAKEAVAKIVTGLSPEQKREFVIKDNGENWGQWDFDILANGWDDLPLVDWGIKMNEYSDDPNAEWEGMPEFGQEDLSSFRSVKVHFANQKDVDIFSELVNQILTDKTRSIWYPEAKKINMRDTYES